MSWILTWVRKILVCIILGNIFIRLLPSEKYQKYLKLYWGFVTLIVLLNPVIYLVNGAKGLETIYEKNSFQMEKKQISDQLQEGIQENVKIELQVLDEKLKQQLNKNLKDDQYEVISINTSMDQVTTCKVILKNKLGFTNENSENEKQGRDVFVIKERIKNKIYDFYQVEKQNIDISIQE